MAADSRETAQTDFTLGEAAAAHQSERVTESHASSSVVMANPHADFMKPHFELPHIRPVHYHHGEKRYV